MKMERKSVKRLGAVLGLLAMAGVAGTWGVRAADPQPVYRVASDAVVGENALRGAIDPLFEDDAMGDTRALLVMRDGEVIAERYAPGFGPDSGPFSGALAYRVSPSTSTHAPRLSLAAPSLASKRCCWVQMPPLRV